MIKVAEIPHELSSSQMRSDWKKKSIFNSTSTIILITSGNHRKKVYKIQGQSHNQEMNKLIKMYGVGWNKYKMSWDF